MGIDLCLLADKSFPLLLGDLDILYFAKALLGLRSVDLSYLFIVYFSSLNLS